MSELIRNRIKCHRRVRAAHLVPHEYNWRLHPAGQQAALKALYEEVGFARSLLAYELPDGRLKLIDGHLRRELDPEMEVDVEVLDVNDDEARALLLSMDPLAALAETQAEIHRQLLEMTPTSSPELEALWRAQAEECLQPAAADAATQSWAAKFLVLVQCRDEKEQAELLQQFTAQGLTCRALLG